MSLDEKLFGKLHRWWQQRRQASKREHEFALEPHAARWQRLGSLVRGRDLQVRFGGEPGELGAALALPEALPIASNAADTQDVARFQVAVAAAVDCSLASGADPAEPLAPTVLSWLEREWPATLELLPAVRRHLAAVGVSLPNPDPESVLAAMIGTLPRRHAAPPPRDTDPADHEALPRGTERQNRAVRTPEVIEIQTPDDGANPLAHVFEKVKTAEEHTGGNRSMDGDDELDEHLEALEELDLRRVVRSRNATRSVFAADLDIRTTSPELVPEQATPAEFTYDEWDAARQRYLPGWCTVHEQPTEPASPATAAALLQSVRTRYRTTIARLRAEFTRLARGAAPRRRQPVGAEIDIDAYVRRHGDLLAAVRGHGQAGDEGLYIARRPALREVAILLLLDRSLSSDSWVRGRRVLDATREAVLAVGEATADLRLQVAIGALSSHTHRDCRYDVIADFGDPWPLAQRRLAGLHPSGYTRIGPALRHATEILKRQPARRRLLLLLSDCKPVDYDHYEGRRGIGDVRKAIAEAHRAGVGTLALAIDRAAPPHLPRMFGRDGFRVLPDAAHLATAMARLHERLLH